MKQIDFSRFKCLCVDDLSAHRELLKSMLWQAGARSIDLAVDGADAVGKMARNKYDIILCDYNLGDGQDGQQVLEEAMFRKLLSYNTIYIMITAENASNMVRGAMEYSPDDYLIKPISREILAHRAKRLLEKKQAMKGIHDATEAKNYALAITRCDEVASKHKNLQQDLLKLKAGLYCKAQQYDEADAIYQRAFETRRQQWAWLGLGKIALQRKDYACAIEQFNSLMCENADCLEAYDYLATAYEGAGELLEAQRVLALAASISPKALLRQRALGRVALLNNDPEIAMKAMKQAIKLARCSYFHSIEDYIVMANVCLALDDYSSAIAALTNAQKEFKRDLTSQLRVEVLLCIIDFQHDREDKARLIWDSVKRLLVNYHETMPQSLIDDLMRAAKMLQDEGIAEIAGLDAETVKEKVHSQAKKCRALNKAGIALYKEGYLQEAIVKFSKALKGLPENVGILLNYAQVLIAESKTMGLDQASNKNIRRYLKKAKALEPDNPRIKGLEKAYLELKKH